MARGKQISDETIIKALQASAGIVSIAAEKIGWQRTSLSRKIHNSEKLLAICDEIGESMLDLAESKLLLALRNGNMTAIIFYLKTKGKQRGYIERQEMRGVSEEEINAEIERELARLADRQEDPIPR
jgi:hypothetical protein